MVLAIVVIWTLDVIGLVRPTSSEITQFIEDAPTRRPLRTDVGKYILANTTPEDSVLYWNIGAEVYFETGQRSPSRCFYMLPLFQLGHNDAQRWDEFLNDVKTNRPPLLITLNNTGYTPMFDVQDQDIAVACGCSGEILAGFKEFTEYVRENYDREYILKDTFIAYHLKDH